MYHPRIMNSLRVVWLILCDVQSVQKTIVSNNFFGRSCEVTMQTKSMELT